MVPAIIMRTFQSIAVAKSPQGSMPMHMKRKPVKMAMYALHFGNTSNRT